MPKSRVVLNRRGFGAVLASVEMEGQLRPFAQRVASKVPGAKIRAVRTGVGSGNSRVRWRVECDPKHRALLIAAMRSVMGDAKPR